MVDSIPFVSDLFRDQAKLDILKRDMENAMKQGLSDVATTASDIGSALSSQKRFVFPGAGTFDMNSPIFNKNGDLLIGLSYRLGESA
jgi:hypothetical protein